MDKNLLQEKLKQKLINFVADNEIETGEEIQLSTRLIGSGSLLDSIELVTFIVETEQLLDDEFDFQTQLASEKAMSRRNSPFISIQTLSDYIMELYNE